MNAKAKRRRSVPEASRQESPGEAGIQEAARAAEGFPATTEGRLILKDHGVRCIRLDTPGEYPACNPSIAKNEKGELLAVVRTVNYELGVEGGISFGTSPRPDTVNWLVHLDDDLNQVKTLRINEDAARQLRVPARDGLEDARLIWWRNGWWYLASACHHGPRCRNTMALCRISHIDSPSVDELEFLVSPRNFEREKNWMPFVDGSRLGFLYYGSPAESYEIWPQNRRLNMGGDDGRLKGWSGSSQLIRFGEWWLGVVHQRQKQRGKHVYAHRLVTFNDLFIPVQVGREFFFRDETVEFCAGLTSHRGNFLLSFGLMDKEAWLCELSHVQVASLLASQ
jgi:hypothetical protein